MMQIVQVDEIPMKERLSGGRGGTWEYRRVMAGDPDQPDNFSLVIYYHNGSFFSPRHHHNFDQFRYQIDGDADFGSSGTMKRGTLAYFPEGAYYGPTKGPAHTVAVLQFGGPSGLGYMGSKSRGARSEMEGFGRFEKGVFRRNEDVEGRRNQDSYEAIWEHVHKRPIEYPEPQYGAPVMMQTDTYPWVPMVGTEGVEERALATLTSARIGAASYRLQPGAELTIGQRGICYTLSGHGTVSGEPLRDQTTVFVDSGEQALFRADAVTEILFMGMPPAAEMGVEGGGALAAAE